VPHPKRGQLALSAGATDAESNYATPHLLHTTQVVSRRSRDPGLRTGDAVSPRLELRPPEVMPPAITPPYLVDHPEEARLLRIAWPYAARLPRSPSARSRGSCR
jgi:hypothetical protein